MKIIAWYLPQFHETPENNEWWGEGFTEWTNVKKAQKYQPEQNQPRVPLDNNYYNLLDNKTKHWQVDLAKKYGVYGFCMHHYWFDGKLLLEKPVEQYLEDKSLDLPFCLCWANEHWTNSWAAGGYKVLIEQRYGDEKQWKEHFEYLNKFFSDERYIKVDNKPLMIIYRPELIECLNPMIDYWQKLAKEYGLDGLCMAYQGSNFDYVKNMDNSRFEFDIEYQPSYAFAQKRRKKYDFVFQMKDFIAKKLTPIFKFDFGRVGAQTLLKYSYKDIWEIICNTEPRSEKSVPGAFVDWDNSPRKGNRGSYMSGVTPGVFKEYLKKQILRAKNVYHKDMIFIFAWNEWAESGYLEPDDKFGYGFLQSIKEALEETGELEFYK